MVRKEIVVIHLDSLLDTLEKQFNDLAGKSTEGTDKAFKLADRWLRIKNTIDYNGGYYEKKQTK